MSNLIKGEKVSILWYFWLNDFAQSLQDLQLLCIYKGCPKYWYIFHHVKKVDFDIDFDMYFNYRDLEPLSKFCNSIWFLKNEDKFYCFGHPVDICNQEIFWFKICFWNLTVDTVKDWTTFSDFELLWSLRLVLICHQNDLWS